MKILIIGGGTMGTTYGLSFLRSHVVSPEDLMILEKSQEKLDGIKEMGFRHVFSSFEDCVDPADLIILAVKPQDIDQLFADMRKSRGIVDKLILSIMAGVRMSDIRAALQTHRIIRAMPNLPAQVSAGMTVFTATSQTTRKDLLQVQNLINTTGKSIYVEEESMIDAATALSGSGPAYVFEFMKIMTEAGQHLGFTESEAELLTLQTFRGAIEIFTNKDLRFEQWIELVASKGGTTEAAITRFGDKGLASVIHSGILAAHERAIALGKRK